MIAVTYDVWLRAADPLDPIQTKTVPIQAATKAEAMRLGQEIAKINRMVLIKVERRGGDKGD